ncbi:hypothetical protein [Actinoallomurus rhizosphaericola]|uniref:hypothetical protein n=1 Tax=Actinoallomurus rhizosphaericola TaxID=2952536 RepID=UPI0020931E8E|nr:hypothetical protein [Actinoallomurus rhizosphaericola]MCO5999773.1 hypothetical protein [Actinoallomurus rhizosphaericola]
MTTIALALALGWPREVVLAECDPAGRRILPGYLAERLDGPPGPGLLGLATALGGQGTRVEDYTIPLAERGRAWLLHGIRDPRHASRLARLWQPLAGLLTESEADVIADVGRVGSPDTPMGLLAGANLVVMVLRGTLAQVDAAQPRLDALLSALNWRVPVALCLIQSGCYSAAAVSRALFELPVLAELPHAPADANVLSDGARPRMAFRTCLLLRTAGSLGHQMRKLVEERAFHPETLSARAASSGGTG